MRSNNKISCRILLETVTTEDTRVSHCFYPSRSDDACMRLWIGHHGSTMSFTCSSFKWYIHGFLTKKLYISAGNSSRQVNKGYCFVMWIVFSVLLDKHIYLIFTRNGTVYISTAVIDTLRARKYTCAIHFMSFLDTETSRFVEIGSPERTSQFHTVITIAADVLATHWARALTTMVFT